MDAPVYKSSAQCSRFDSNSHFRAVDNFVSCFMHTNTLAKCQDLHAIMLTVRMRYEHLPFCDEQSGIFLGFGVAQIALHQCMQGSEAVAGGSAV